MLNAFLNSSSSAGIGRGLLRGLARIRAGLNSWPVYVAVAASLLAGLVGAVWLDWQRSEDLSAMSVRLETKRAALAMLPATELPTQEDFTTSLPLYPQADKLLNEMRTASEQAGVAWLELQSQERAATKELLGLTEMSFQLRGSYPQIKQVLHDVQARNTSSTLRHLAIHRVAPGSPEVEATLTLGLWARPLSATPASLPAGS